MTEEVKKTISEAKKHIDVRGIIIMRKEIDKIIETKLSVPF